MDAKRMLHLINIIKKVGVLERIWGDGEVTLSLCHNAATLLANDRATLKTMDDLDLKLCNMVHAIHSLRKEIAQFKESENKELNHD